MPTRANSLECNQKTVRQHRGSPAVSRIFLALAVASTLVLCVATVAANGGTPCAFSRLAKQKTTFDANFRSLARLDVNNGDDWQECAAQCALHAECVRWSLPNVNRETKCQLIAMNNGSSAADRVDEAAKYET